MSDERLKSLKLKFLKPVNEEIEKEKIEKREQYFFYHYNYSLPTSNT